MKFIVQEKREDDVHYTLILSSADQERYRISAGTFELQVARLAKFSSGIPNDVWFAGIAIGSYMDLKPVPSVPGQ